MRYDKALWDILKEIDDIEDPTFEFLASCFSYCLAKGGLTDKQAKIIDKYIDKYRYLWSESNKNELKLIEGGKNAAIN
jgi:hypothetical protein|uniref:MA3 domain n=1 Tax=Siphoviridae sp. ct5qs5 TaxID=2825339 RepID=A0A8S5Q8U2_9CAUD|nr:MAG TPA: MA3 domain [Siphoviridae sp. ct5qs5]DAT71938.1 MAG TPA: MA3 domain [Caudoviricetes sp.]DAW90937.1 MAG TPA: MA3 domain [Caudoviricetes sp.]